MRCKKILLLVTGIMITSYFFLAYLESQFAVYLKNNNVSNVFYFLSFLFVFFPLVWISFIKYKKIKLFLYTLNVLYILWFFYNWWLAALFALADVTDMNGKGYRRAFAVEIARNRYFCVYRTPDEGALGGDDFRYFKVDEVFPGFEKRIETSSSDFVMEDGRNYFRYQNRLYHFPDEDYMYENHLGGLLHENKEP